MFAIELTCALPVISGYYFDHELYARYERWFWNPQSQCFPDGPLTSDEVQRHFDAIYH